MQVDYLFVFIIKLSRSTALLYFINCRYGNQKQCGVLGDEPLLYSLAIPLMVISLLNMIFFILTMKKMSKKKWDMSRCSCCKRHVSNDSRVKNGRNATANR